jgi:TatD DNase family protein
MNYIDIHTHTYYQAPETSIILNLFPEDGEKLELPVYFSVGLHPWFVKEETWKEKLEKIRTLAIHEKTLAIGEAGLDKITDSSFETQIKAFHEQITIAEDLRKPLIIHCVRSYSELLGIRKKSDKSVPWILHWYSGDEHIARELIRKNCFLSFGHMLYKEESKAFRVYQNLPLNQVFFETDDAGFTIEEIYSKASLIRKISESDLKTQIMDNFNRCFQL